MLYIFYDSTKKNKERNYIKTALIANQRSEYPNAIGEREPGRIRKGSGREAGGDGTGCASQARAGEE